MATKAAAEEQIRVWRPAVLPGIEIMQVAGCHRLWRWYHEVHAITVVHRGMAEYHYQQREHTARPGDTLLMEPGEVHADRRVEGPTSFRVLFLAPEVLARFPVEQAGAEMHLRVPRTHDALLFRAVTALHAALDRDPTPLEAQCRLAVVLNEVVHRYAERSPRPADTDPGAAALLRARDLLHASPGRTVSLDDLAAAVGLSKFHLLRTFTKRFGLPPHTYHTQLRIATARSLLAHGVPISRVALETGFADQSHLTRHFARNMGLTPGAYVRNTRGGLSWRDEDAPVAELLAV